MQNSKLGLDFTKVAHAKDVARKIADDVQKFVEQYSTVAVERTLCRLLGIDGVDANTVPLPNVLVDEIKDKGVLGEGILFFLGNAIVETGMNRATNSREGCSGRTGYHHVTRSPEQTRFKAAFETSR